MLLMDTRQADTGWCMHVACCFQEEILELCQHDLPELSFWLVSKSDSLLQDMHDKVRHNWDWALPCTCLGLYKCIRTQKLCIPVAVPESPASNHPFPPQNKIDIICWQLFVPLSAFLKVNTREAVCSALSTFLNLHPTIHSLPKTELTFFEGSSLFLSVVLKVNSKKAVCSSVFHSRAWGSGLDKGIEGFYTKQAVNCSLRLWGCPQLL